jgi:CBS domain-containing protein
MPAKTAPKKKAAPAAETVPLKALATEKSGALNPEDTVETAGERMREHQTDTWPVAEDRKLVGMIDRENPDWKLGGHGHDPKTWKVGEIMTRDTVFCYEDEDCTVAQLKMDERDLHYLPVVDRQMRIVGIFRRDEIRAKAEATRTVQTSNNPQ